MTEPLGPTHNRAAFSCGSVPLDRYLREQAGQDARQNAARTYVWSDNGTNVLGYYTLSACSAQHSSIDAERRAKLARYADVPGILIGRLAVCTAQQRKGIGGALLIDALRRCMEVSKSLGVALVVVDAKDERAAAFYRRHGFVPLADQPLRLITRIVDVEAMLEE